MKKVVAVALLGLANTFAHGACVIQEQTTDTVRNVVKANGGYPISDEACAFLTRNKLKLRLAGVSTVLSGASVGWVNLSLINSNNTISFAQHSATYVNTGTASMNIADELLYKAISDAVQKLDYQQALREIKEIEAKRK